MVTKQPVAAKQLVVTRQGAVTWQGATPESLFCWCGTLTESRAKILGFPCRTDIKQQDRRTPKFTVVEPVATGRDLAPRAACRDPMPSGQNERVMAAPCG